MTPDTSDLPRQLGNYDLLEKIAEGGMGAVYRGRNRSTNEIVAIKVIPPDTARNPLLLKRFEQEFKAACLIDHPNVVKALDYCGTGPSPFLVMEFVDGETIGQRVDRDGAIPENESIRLIGLVCEGLHRAHKQGLIHRDVKPDNIMISSEGIAKLTDLGLVKDVEGEMNLTKTGRGLGTPHYMAPEQFRNAKNADVRCDVYSLGATLYMMVTGEVPFNNTSPLDCWLRKTKNDIAEPKSLNPELSDRTNWAINRAMSSDAAQRPASCREFMEDLTGTGWFSKANSSAASASAPESASSAEDIWYLVFRDNTGQLHTVKGSTDSIRRNVTSGSLGDLSTILVSRTKTGQFVPLRSTPEFRDLVVGPTAPPATTPTSRITKTSVTSRTPVTKQNTPKSQAGQITPRPTPLPTPVQPQPASAKTNVGAQPTRKNLSKNSKDSDKLNRWLPLIAILIAIASFGIGLLIFLK